MAARPNELPRWGTDLSNVTEPNEGQKDTGWTVGQAPSSAVQNWYQEKVYRWLEHMADTVMLNEINALLSVQNLHDTGFTVDLTDITVGGSSVITVGPTGSITRFNLNTGAVVDDTAPSADDLNAIAFGETAGLFVAVGAADRIITSSGNGTWTSRSDTGDDLFDVAISSTGIVVAVGANGALKRSTNSTTYTDLSTTAGAEDLLEVTWGFKPDNTECVVTVSETGDVWHSLDGSSWTQVRSATGVGPANIGYHPNYGFVVRDQATVATSPDGETWTDATSIGALLTDYARMTLLPTGVAWVHGDTVDSVSHIVYALAPEFTRLKVMQFVIVKRAFQRFTVLDGGIWALTGDQVHRGGQVEFDE